MQHCHGQMCYGMPQLAVKSLDIFNSNCDGIFGLNNKLVIKKAKAQALAKFHYVLAEWMEQKLHYLINAIVGSRILWLKLVRTNVPKVLYKRYVIINSS